MKNKAIDPYKIAVFVSICVIFILFIRNLDNPNLWFDESGQFWMSMGLNHYSDPYSQAGGLSDIIRNNNAYNMDPGGFTVLLRPWLEVSTNALWLRAFPLLFFLFTFCLFVYYNKTWTGSNLIAVVISLLLLASPYVIQNSFELRPYSWSFFSMICCFFIVEKLRLETRNIYFLGAGLLLAILMWGRYNCIVQVFGSMLVLFFVMYKKGEKTSDLFSRLLCLSIPIVISLIGIIIITLLHQHIGSTTAEYVKWITIRYNPAYFKSLPFLWSIFPLIIYLVLYSLIKRKYSTYSSPILDTLFYFTIIENALFIVLSILGLYPYSFRHRWNVDLHVLSLLNLTALASILYTYSLSNNFIRKYNIINKTCLLICSIVILLHISSNRFDAFKYKEGEQTSSTLKFLFSKNINSLTIPTWYYPNVRYLYEFGSLERDDSKLRFYPQNIATIKESEVDLNKIKTDGVIITNQMSVYNSSPKWELISLENTSCYINAGRNTKR